MSRFRSEYRALRSEEVSIIASIKMQAEDLDIAIQNTSMYGTPDPRCIALARTKLEEAVMWAVKGVSA